MTAVLFLMVVPLLIGSAMLILMKQKYSIALSYSFGWMLLLAIFELIAIPCVFADKSLTQLTMITNICVLVLAVSAGVFLVSKKKVLIGFVKNLRMPEMNLYMMLALVLVCVQVVIMMFGMHTDTDDVYYIGTASTSLATDTLFKFEPDTGLMYYSKPLRYVFSALMLFWAYLSKITGVHLLILAHSIVSVILLIMSYALWWRLSAYLFKKENQRWIFLLFLCVFNIFGYTSAYTQSSFLLFRIWQGKAFLPNIMFPLLLITAMMIHQEPKMYRLWVMVFFIAGAACCCSSMGVPLGMLAIASVTLALVWKHRDWKMLLCGVLGCLPCVLIGAAYLICSL